MDYMEEVESLTEALLAITSSEEYAAKIARIQQACLVPLKEDLADWLNKIMNTTAITSDNFMNRLDNGVIICHLAKVISVWCLQQYQQQQNLHSSTLSNNQIKLTSSPPTTLTHNNTTTTTTIATKINSYTPNGIHNYTNSNNYGNTTQTRSSSQMRLNHHHLESPSKELDMSSSGDNNGHNKLSTSTSNVNSSTDSSLAPNGSNPNPRHTTTLLTQTPMRQPRLRPNLGPAGLSPSSPLSNHNRLASLSTTCLPNGYSSLSSIAMNQNQLSLFVDNLNWMNQIRIWDDAKCRTFYARDNVSHFIKWSKEFGVNQSVLFESDDLVQHANTRQVVLCLLEVARIACVKHGFTEAPGLVKFEQEIELIEKQQQQQQKEPLVANSTPKDPDSDRLAIESARAESPTRRPAPRASLADAAAARGGPTKTSGARLAADPTDDLILRYCRHKEQVRARKEAEEAAAAAAAALEMVAPEEPSLIEAANISKQPALERNDSLDSGEGRTESAATSNSSGANLAQAKVSSSIPVPVSSGSGSGKRASGSRSPSSESLGCCSSSANLFVSSRSSSRSSLLSSNIEEDVDAEMESEALASSSTSQMHSNNSNNKIQQNNKTRPSHSSELDGKVMRIAKSYYGSKPGVTRLSEGKYRIADRIVFVRLLKGQRVMVRIGGGWDTLENFLFRHKSDPSQVIDVDNLLPLDTSANFAPPSSMSSSSPANRKVSDLSASQVHLTSPLQGPSTGHQHNHGSSIPSNGSMSFRPASSASTSNSNSNSIATTTSSIASSSNAATPSSQLPRPHQIPYLASTTGGGRSVLLLNRRRTSGRLAESSPAYYKSTGDIHHFDNNNHARLNGLIGSQNAHNNNTTKNGLLSTRKRSLNSSQQQLNSQQKSPNHPTRSTSNLLLYPATLIGTPRRSGANGTGSGHTGIQLPDIKSKPFGASTGSLAATKTANTSPRRRQIMVKPVQETNGHHHHQLSSSRNQLLKPLNSRPQMSSLNGQAAS